MSDGIKVNTEGGGGKWGGGVRNNFRNNSQLNNNAESHTSKLEYLETTTYIVILFYLDNQYDKATKYIIKYVIRKLPGRVQLAHGTSDGKLPKMFLDTNPKQENNPDGTSEVEKDGYELQVMEWKDNKKTQIERKRHVNKGNQNIYAILINQSSP